MTIGIILDHNNVDAKKARFVFETFFSILGFSYSIFIDNRVIEKFPLIICYGFEKTTEYQSDYLNGGGVVINIPVIKTEESNVNELISEIRDSDVIQTEFGGGTLIDINIDLISSVYYLLTLQEEVNSKKRDIHLRFIGEYSDLDIKNFIQEPIVNEYISLLDGLIKRGFAKCGLPLFKICCWPNGEDFAVFLSHDVDVIKKWKLFDILISKKLFFRLLSNRSLIGITGRSVKIWEFNKILEIEKRFGLKSTFFFSVNGDNKFDVNYNVGDSEIKKIIREISKAGWEIGLHSSYDSYLDRDKLVEEKKVLESIIEKNVVGCRQHYLRFEIPTTWDIQDKMKLLFDSSLGFPDIYGFRCGICHPFNPYNDLEKKRYDLIEIPLLVMDVTLAEYMDISTVEALEKIKDLIDVVKQYNGVLSILWHHRYFNEKKYPRWANVYEKVLEYLDSLNAYIATSEEIAGWWETRNSLKFECLSVTQDKSVWTLNSSRKVDKLCLEILTPEYADKYKIVIENTDQNKVNKNGRIIEIKINNLVPNSNVKVIISNLL